MTSIASFCSSSDFLYDSLGEKPTDSILRYALHNNFNILQCVHPNKIRIICDETAADKEKL